MRKVPLFGILTLVMICTGGFLVVYLGLTNPSPEDPEPTVQLELFTDKSEYEIGEDVVLTFENPVSNEFEVILPNGAPFMIEFRDLESGEQVIYSLPAIEMLIIVHVGERITWTLSVPEGLKGAGHYTIMFDVYLEEGQKPVLLYTTFTVGEYTTTSELFTDNEVYNEGESVTLVFVNKDPLQAEGGKCLDIIHREREDGPSTPLLLPCIEIWVFVPIGGNITWILSPSELNGPGYYTISYSFYIGGVQLETLQTQFMIFSTDS